MSEKIALGLGDNIDYEIAWDSRVFEDLIRRYGIHQRELSTDVAIRSERDLVRSILGFLQLGVGGERFVASSETIERFAQRFEKKITLGGTSVRAAIAMRKLGYTSALHLVTINEHVRRLIPHDSPYVCSNARETLYPHLIVQFDKGSRIRAGDIDLRAGRENRIIYHNDLDNIVMELDEDFGDLITGAQVFLISGFNAMQSEKLLLQRLATLGKIMQRLPAGAQVFYEDAGFYQPRFSQLVYSTLAARIGIYSLNEDELQAHLDRRVDPLDADQVVAALVDLQQLIGVPVIVVHSRYWALAYGDESQRFRQALSGGVTMATSRFCFGDDFTAHNYRTIARLPANPQGADFAAAVAQRQPDRLCCVPVAAVDPPNPTTVGLGDAFVGGFLPALLA